MSKKVLGRGLGALIPVGGGNTPGNGNSGIHEVPVDQIIPNPYQPRKYFDEEKLQDLVSSIKENGIIQPIVVTKVQEGYQIVVGERRWRAAKQVGLRQVPVIIKDLSPQDRVALALVENLQRDDLNALEEAQAFHFLVEGFGLTQEDLSKRIGRSRPYITNTLRLLNLPEAIKSFVVDGKISPGHARALLTIDDPKEAAEIAERIVAGQLSVRQTESLVKRKEAARGRKAGRFSHPFEKELQHALGTRVRIHVGKRGGKIEISYKNAEELESLAQFLGRVSPQDRHDLGVLL